MILCLCLQSLEVLLRHPEDNRNQIRELAQTLMDGGILDELIQQKLDAFNRRWDELMARVRQTDYIHDEEGMNTNGYLMIKPSEKDKYYWSYWS